MSADKHPTMKCPFCSWSSRTYNASAHFLKHHSAKIHIRPVTNDHCLYAYVVHDKEEIEFCGCLTCGKGTLGDGNFGNSSRWIEMHSKNKACKDLHRKKLADLRDSIRVANTVAAPPTEAPTVTTAAPGPILHSVWASLKKNKPFVPFMEDVEVFCKMCNEDSDDDFDPTEAFEHSIRCAVSDRNNISQHKIEMNKIENEHDTVVANMQYDIKQLKQQVAGLQDYINDQAKRTSDLERRLALLERENKRYKAVYPELPAEDPQ